MHIANWRMIIRFSSGNANIYTSNLIHPTIKISKCKMKSTNTFEKHSKYSKASITHVSKLLKKLGYKSKLSPKVRVLKVSCCHYFKSAV